MLVDLKKTALSCYKAAFEDTIVQEERAEAVVPDIYPDISRIVRARGMLMLRSKDVDEGCVSVAGSVSVTILYVPEGESGLRSLPVSVPFEVIAEALCITSSCRAVACVRVLGIEARMLNPRKVSVRVELEAYIRCYEQCEITCSKHPEKSENGLRIRSEGIMVTPVIAVTEKSFVLTDEYRIGTSMPPLGELLDTEVSLSPEEAKPVGNKLIFKGSAAVSILYRSDTDGAEVSVGFTTNFSQIIELGGIGESPDAEIMLALTGVWFEALPADDGGRAVSAELHIVAQAICAEQTELAYIDDAYSTMYDLELSREQLLFDRVERRMSVRESMRELVELQSGVAEITSVRAGVESCTVSGGDMTVSVDVHIIYRGEDGGVFGTSARLRSKSRIELEDGMTARVVSAVCAEAYAAPAAGGVEVRVPVDAELLITSSVSVSAVQEISLDEDMPRNIASLPSLVILNVDETADIWKLAKLYNSTPELISSINSTEPDSAPGSRVLLIPKASR